MIQRLRTLIDQLHDVPGKAEIVRGEIQRMSPAGIRHNRGAGAIYFSLLEHERTVGGGYAFSDNAGFLVDLPQRKSFSPDAAWLAGELDEQEMDFIDGAPTFAVEVRSKRDYGPAAETAIANKIAEYFAAGTLVVWDVDFKSQQLISCHRAGSTDQPQVFRAGDLADAEPAVPTWRFDTLCLKP